MPLLALVRESTNTGQVLHSWWGEAFHNSNYSKIVQKTNEHAPPCVESSEAGQQLVKRLT